MYGRTNLKKWFQIGSKGREKALKPEAGPDIAGHSPRELAPDGRQRDPQNDMHLTLVIGIAKILVSMA